MNPALTTTPPAATLKNVERAARNLRGVIYKTPLLQNHGLSRTYGATVLLKREDLQVVRSYKIRGAYHKMSTLPAEASGREIVCASAGNHAQGVAYACQLLRGIFLPAQTRADFAPPRPCSAARATGWIL